MYTPNDGGIIYSMTRGNKWAIINLGTSASGGNAVSQLYDMDSGEHFPVTYNGRALSFTMASNDGNIVVGRMGQYALTYNRATGEVHSYPNRPLWNNGQLVDCTPDGHYAVGYYEGYLGKSDDSDMPNDWFYRPLYVNVLTGDTIYTPNMPTTNSRGGKLQSIKFSSITPDGRYISGAVDWYMEGGFHFFYDTKTKQVIRNKSLMQLYGGDIASRYADVKSCSGSMMSPDGNAIGGTANIVRDGVSATAPCVYFRDRDELVVYADAEDGNVNIEAMDNAGTFFGINETGSPLRSFKILYDGKYWVTLNQICHQRFGYDFFERTGYERTGTIMGVSGDGHKLISFHDPMGESYCFDFGMSVEEACSGLNMLGTYTVTPEGGAQFAQLSSVEVRFERPVQILGSGKNVHLYDSKGQLVANGLTSSAGLTHKTGSQQTVIANFRARVLDDNEQYTVVIDAGAIATAKDEKCVNEEIRIIYKGRDNGPVKMTQVVPKDGSSLLKLDNQGSYILMTFDCKVSLTDDPVAYIERVSDGTIATSLHMIAGTAEETKQQVLMYPEGVVNLYAGQDYRLVVKEGSIIDYTGNEKSKNERIEVLLHGTYVRVVPTGNVLFSDAWDNIAESLQLWLRYEGDHNKPLASMQAWEFDSDNQPWNFSIRESNESYDYCAASHSLYAPSGKSDDWMMTPQISLPAEGKCTVEFDSQGYNPNAKDTLEVYVFEEEWVLSYLNDAWMEDVKERSQLVFKEIIPAGATQEGLTNEWTHYTIDISAWNGKDVYVAFVNHNRNQSAIFIDNVVVQRELLYDLALDFEDRVVAQTEQQVSGSLIVRKEGVRDITMILRNDKDAEIDRIEWRGISGNIKDRPVPFAFASAMPLVSGAENAYSIEVQLDERKDVYNGTVTNLAFLPTKRVVLEEMTGVDCVNCPLGITVIESLRKTYGDRFIPISLHTYFGDPYESGMTAYSNFLGLNAAPSARIDRTDGIYMPITSSADGYVVSNPASPQWVDVVAEQMGRMALCDVDVEATLSADGKSLNCKASVKSALTTNTKQYSILFVVLEDGLEYYQANSFGQVDDKALGEWGLGGEFSGGGTGVVYPVMHCDVARGVVGTTLGGSIGLLPSELKAGATYTAETSSTFPTTVVEPKNASVACLLIDTQSGQVVNAARCAVQSVATGVEGISGSTSVGSDVYNLSGRLVLRNASASQLQSLPAGVYVVAGKKIVVR